MLTIAWDIDDVLNDLTRSWLENWWKPKHPDCRLKFDDISVNPPHHLLGVPLEHYLMELDAFRRSGAYSQLPPVATLFAWFEQYGAGFRHIALTAVPRKAADVSAAWVLSHFGDWIRSFHFVPSPRPGDIHTSYEKSKAGYLKWLNRVDIFIDDHPGHIQEARAEGIRSYLVERPWNANGMPIDDILSNIVKIKPS